MQKKNAKRDLEIAGGACGGVELCLDGKDLSALVVSHTFHSFLIFQRGESTCRGTGPIFLARPLFTGGLDQFYFYQPQHPCVAHHSCCSLLSTKSVQHSNLELFSPPLLFIHHLIHHRFQTCLTHLTQLSPPMPNFWLVNLLLVSGVRLTTLLSAAKVCHCYSCTKN